MARFERSRGRRDPKDRCPRGDSRGREKFDRDPRGDRGSGRDFKRRGSRDLEMTRVTCSGCGSECEVPFKPTSNKPIYCRDCFSKKGGRGSDRRPNNHSDSDLALINEKLDKIIRALNIE